MKIFTNSNATERAERVEFFSVQSEILPNVFIFVLVDPKLLPLLSEGELNLSRIVAGRSQHPKRPPTNDSVSQVYFNLLLFSI